MKEEDNNSSKVKILKCDKCNSFPYFKFYMDDYPKKLKIFLKCKCNEIDTTNFDLLNKYFILADKLPIKEKKFKSDYLTDDIYKQIINGFKLAKEKLYIKLKEIKENEIKILYDRIDNIENIYNETLNQNKKILNIIQILIDTYENYSSENQKSFEILSQNIINNTNFNLEIKNIFNSNYNSEEKIIYINNYKYNLQQIKSISLPIFDGANNYNINSILLSNKKLLSFCENKFDESESKILNISLNENLTIKDTKIINNFFYYKDYFEIDKEKIFFNKDGCWDNSYYILNIKTSEVNKLNLLYDSCFKYINGNIIGFNSNKIDIINLKGEVLLSKEKKNGNYRNGFLLPNNHLIFINSEEIFLFDDKLKEIKKQKTKQKYYYPNIAVFNKKIWLINYKIYIFNFNLENESIINCYNYNYGIRVFSIKNYISIYDFCFTFIDSKKYILFKDKYDIPFLFNQNKLIFGRLRYEINRNKNFKLLYDKNKIFIVYSNLIQIYQEPIKY